jgi:hypothetical protein
VYLILVAGIVWVDLQHSRVNEVCHKVSLIQYSL